MLMCVLAYILTILNDMSIGIPKVNLYVTVPLRTELWVSIEWNRWHVVMLAGDFA